MPEFLPEKQNQTQPKPLPADLRPSNELSAADALAADKESLIADPALRGNSIDAQILQLGEIAKLNPNVDVSNLILGALDKEHTNRTTTKSKRWAYLISVGLPGAGYLCAIYFYFFSGKNDGKHVAWWCIGLTTFTIVLTWITTAVIFSSITQTTGQQINVNTLEQQPAQLQQLLNQ
jgi:hypothetical protein